MRGLKVDVHAHLCGVGTEGSGCRISPAFRRRIHFRVLRRLHGITDRQLETTVDADWAAALAARVRASELDRAVALGFDGVYDAAGRPDEARTQMLVPPGWVFEACRRHPELLPGPSVNPHRRDALDRLDECVEGGAVLLKWLPSVQCIDPASPAVLPFYRRMADAGLPLLVHSGGSEQTFAEHAPAMKGLDRLRRALEAGVTVIVAHTAAPVIYARDPDPLPLLREWLDRYPRLWVDNSGLSNPSRFPHLPRFAADAALAARSLHGSDFPVPTNAFWYARRLGVARVRSLEAERNPLQRDVAIKRALGYPDDVLTRAGEVLPNVR